VSVPELTISPALKGWVGNRRTMAALSSAKQKAGLLKQFLPDPSSFHKLSVLRHAHLKSR